MVCEKHELDQTCTHCLSCVHVMVFIQIPEHISNAKQHLNHVSNVKDTINVNPNICNIVYSYFSGMSFSLGSMFHPHT